MLRSLEEVFELAKNKKCKRLAVVAAHDPETIKAVVKAKREGLISPILIGKEEEIEHLLDYQNESPKDYEIIHLPDNNEAAKKAVELVKENKVDCLMKGHLDTAEIIRAVVNKDTGIAVDSVVSHVNIMELEKYPKLVVLTDVAINIAPTFEEKQVILANAVKVLKALNYDMPKVAAVCAIEKVNPKMLETVEANQLKEMNQQGLIKDCIIEGPISFDIAMDTGRAARKYFKGNIQGDADILLMPNLLAGNLLSKGLGIFGNGIGIGIVMGAQVPVILSSRGALADIKYQSILGCLAILD